MNSRLSQLLTVALAGTCGVLLLLILMFELGLGRGYSWWPLDDAQSSTVKQDELNRSTFKLAAWQEFADVNVRPLFNEDRKPSPPAPLDAQRDGKPIPRLNVVLSGVVITHKLRMVMVRENGKTETTTVREGGALSGDLGAWSLVRVEPRRAIFKNTAGEDAEVELIATGNGQKPPPPAIAASAHPLGPGQSAIAAAVPAGAGPGQIKPIEQAATELQRRIEARRQQIRDESTRTAPPPTQPAEQQRQ
ncbi:MAG TPA: hypothetical protein VIE67_04670 [Rudaea sp.]|jgi:general secretion pathway protein N|uniref:hypothetical protein n=1 Tax=Rudaea sp. TaxID=2136325 RepID=UPI002F953B73